MDVGASAIAMPPRGPKLFDAIRIVTLLNQLFVDLARNDDLHMKRTRDIEELDSRGVQQRCCVGDNDHVSEGGSDLKSSGS